MNDVDLLLAEKRKYNLDEKVSKKEIRLLKKEYPIQKIIGYIEMANVRIDLSKKVLIPRYETEELVFLAIDLIKQNKYKNILDLCCGSGFIGIAIKKTINNVDVDQIDIDKNAIKQTKINQKLNNVNTNIIKSDMFENIKNSKKYDLIVSNPPYVKYAEKPTISNSVLLYEPHHALFADDEGLEFYKIIEKNLDKYLNKNGMIVLEINPLNVDWFIKNNYKIIKDINSKNRFAIKSIN